MNPITLDVLLAGLAATIAGLTLQMIGRAAFSRFKSDDTKEIAGVVGLRVSAIFGIAVGLSLLSAQASTGARAMDAHTGPGNEPLRRAVEPRGRCDPSGHRLAAGHRR